MYKNIQYTVNYTNNLKANNDITEGDYNDLNMWVSVYIASYYYVSTVSTIATNRKLQL